MKLKRCKSANCYNFVRCKGHFCNTCKSKRYRKQNPIRYAYNNLKSNAKRRGIKFDLDFEYFRAFCYRTKYIQNKGITHDSYTIDRKINKRGYVKGNIRIMTLADNAKKGTKKLNYDWHTRTAKYQ